MNKVITRAIIYSGIGLLISYVIMVSVTFYFLHLYPAHFSDFIFNINFFYTPQTFYNSLRNLTPELINSYPWVIIWDVLVLTLYAAFGTLVLIKLNNSTVCAFSFKGIPLFFIIAALSNLIEDLLMVLLFANFPYEMPFMVISANFTTLTKFVFLFLGIGYILKGILKGIIRTE